MAAGARITVVVAPDSFKGSLTAADAAGAIANGLRDAVDGIANGPAAATGIEGIDIEARLRPVADGGEGSVAVALAAGWTGHTSLVTGPTGEPVAATFALSPDDADDDSPRSALVELATASGLTLLPHNRPEPLNATTRGTGELVRAALDAGAERLVLAIGGSATTDGGAGLLSALGARFLDSHGQPLRPGGAALHGLDRIDISGLDRRLVRTEVVVACDVDNPLTGPSGAAHVYGPQKGAATADVEVLDAALARFAEVVRRDLRVDVEHTPGAGAAGGVGAGAMAFLGASLTPGIDLLLELVGFDDALAGADLVVTGEGSFDAQSLTGKAPVGVARRAHACDVPVVVLAGRVDLDATAREQLPDLGIVATYALLDLEPDQRVAQRTAADLLRRLAATRLPEHLYRLTHRPTPAARSSR